MYYCGPHVSRKSSHVQAGAYANVVQRRLGHKKSEITLTVYAHALPAMQQDAAERLAAILH